MQTQTNTPEQPVTAVTEAPETTEDVLVSMLTENTGTHFLDSGGAYGRHWQRQHNMDKAAFEERPEVKVEFYLREGSERGEINATLDVYHWLKDRLEFNKELDALFFDWVETQNSAYSWFHLVERFVSNEDDDLKEFIESRRTNVADEDEDPEWEYRTAVEESVYDALVEHGHLPDPLDDSRAGFTHNTYNNEDALSQTLQYTLVEFGFAVHCFLFVHGGADVRGGYTKPRAFEVSGNGNGWESFLDNAKMTLGPNPSKEEREEFMRGHPQNEPLLPGISLPPKIDPWDVKWDSDNAGCSWYDAGCAYPDKLLDFEQYPWSEDPEDRGKGKVYFDRENDIAYCPVTGFPLQVFAGP